MKNIILLLLFFPIVLLGQLRIGIIGDQTGAKNLSASYEIMQDGCETIANYKPNIILHVGDIVESSDSDVDIVKDFKQAAGYLDSIRVDGKNVPWFVAAGDHDVNPPDDYTPGTKDYSKENLFKKLLAGEFAKKKPAVNLKNLYYSFNYEGYHFICLFSEDCLRTDPRWGDIFMNRISDKQLNWLRNDLNNAAAAKGTIVFIHQPMWYNWTGWKRVHDLLREHNVQAVIAGHFHYSQDEGTTDGIRYIVVGATGANIKDASENAGGLQHVTLLTLGNGREVSVQMIPLAGYSRHVFTSRKNMDRVQAIDSMITGFNYSGSPYYKKSVEANPIDLPVDVKASSDGKSWTTVYSQVAPGTGILFSNLSSAEVNSYSSPKSVDSTGGTQLVFEADGETYWDRVLY